MMERPNGEALKNMAMASKVRAAAEGEAMDPLLTHGFPSHLNPAEAWLAQLAAAASPTLDQEVEGFLHALVCSDLKVEQVEPGHLICSLPVRPGITNRYWTLHGGAIATLVKIIGCTAIKTIAGARDGTVTDISISYISAVPTNGDVELEAKVLRIGRNIAVASVDVCNKVSKQPAAQGRVTMYFTPASKL